MFATEPVFAEEFQIKKHGHVLLVDVCVCKTDFFPPFCHIEVKGKSCWYDPVSADIDRLSFIISCLMYNHVQLCFMICYTALHNMFYSRA